jgi:lactate dehydrogenase-like 2-hydroxyacid dehydrogenase
VIDVLSLSPAAEGKRAEFEAAGFRLSVVGPSDDPIAVAVSAGPSIRAVVTAGMIGLGAKEIAALPNLEIISTIGAGFDRIDMEAAAARGIVVTRGPGTNADTVADHAMALLFAAVRDIVFFDGAVRAGRNWSEIREMRPSLWQKRLGVVGLGQIGARVAARAAGGFDMTIGYHNRNPAPDAAFRYFASAVMLAAWADFLVVALPGTVQSHHIVNHDVLVALGKKGFLVNVGRGSAVDTGAVITALEAGTIAGAALDVFEGEPIFPAKLSALPNLIVTPHIAGRSPESTDAMFGLVLENLKAHFAGVPAITPV